VGVGEGLTRANDGRQIALHELWLWLAWLVKGFGGRGRTFVEIALVEVVWAGDVHVVETRDLRARSVCVCRRWRAMVRCGGL
jgi:hypothetical protein